MIKPIVFAVAIALFVDVCGYKQAGKGKSLPPDVKTIAIPIFKNTSLKYRCEQRFTQAVMEEVLRRARGLRVTTATEDADVVLEGDIRSFRAVGAILDDQGRTRVWDVKLIVAVVIRYVKTNKIVYENPRMTFSGEYQLSGDPESFFDEENPAIDRIAREFAQSIVSTIMEGL
jgi:hypothetical protein